jgi:hypothetical protein
MEPIINDAFVSETYTTGKDLVRCLRKLEPIVQGEDKATAISALLMLAVALQAPNISEEDIQKVVYEMCKTCCTALTGTDQPTVMGVH